MMDSHPSGNSNCSELHQVHAHSPWHFHLFILIYWLHWLVPEPFSPHGYSSLSSMKSFSERTILMARWVLICKSNLSLIKTFSSYIIQKAPSNHDNKLSNRNSKRIPCTWAGQILAKISQGQRQKTLHLLGFERTNVCDPGVRWTIKTQLQI